MVSGVWVVPRCLELKLVTLFISHAGLVIILCDILGLSSISGLVG